MLNHLTANIFCSSSLPHSLLVFPLLFSFFPCVPSPPLPSTTLHSPSQPLYFFLALPSCLFAHSLPSPTLLLPPFITLPSPTYVRKCHNVPSSNAMPPPSPLTVLPALRPLVVHLFLHTPASLYTQVKLLNAARDMIIEKMLRIIQYEGVMNLFTSILVCRERGDIKLRLARQALASLLPHLSKQQVRIVHAMECS